MTGPDEQTAVACLETRCDSMASSPSAWCAEQCPLGWSSSRPPDAEPPTWTDHFPGGAIREERWEVEGELSRTDGPAVVTYTAEGSVRHAGWYVDGRRHRADGPATVSLFLDGWSEKYYRSGEPHRANGPASVHFAEDGSVIEKHFFLEGTETTAAAVASYAEAIAGGAPSTWALAFALGGSRT